LAEQHAAVIACSVRAQDLYSHCILTLALGEQHV